eukprot:CAMPEP_0118659560 /NCGR_PEP_ID=MMETSP0785-20121206/15180_1 /TAXON_ID=91992 /ORGANISM="Bolidomonas pacifica, Strain CCMP 1866" /LENGTH=109 /DNA_ID=CAMNT_0006552679 /DNA_START=39 /DNA_END=365 /DNA_ORIENTATION=-
MRSLLVPALTILGLMVPATLLPLVGRLGFLALSFASFTSAVFRYDRSFPPPMTGRGFPIFNSDSLASLAFLASFNTLLFSTALSLFASLSILAKIALKAFFLLASPSFS